MIAIKEAYKKVMEKKPKGFLCSVFVMCAPEDIDNINWQLDFYSKGKDRIDSYLVKKDVETLSVNQEAFKEKNKELKEINLDNIKVDWKTALKLAEKEIKEDISKIIILLQNLDKEIWNISFFTKSFNLINVKIDAKTKKIMEKSNQPLIQF